MVREMQRSQLLRSSQESASPRPSRAFSRAISRCFAAGSSSGIRPSGGSTTSASRMIVPVRSIHAAPVPCVAAITACRANWSRSFSASVRRSIGVSVELFHTPRRSGAPHGVRGNSPSAGGSSPATSVRAPENNGPSCPAAGAASAVNTMMNAAAAYRWR